MADRSCPVCSARTSAGDQFCAACGVRLDAPVVLDGDNPSSTTTEQVRSGGRLSALLVPLLVLGVVALGAVALLGGGDDEADDPGNESIAEPSPTVEIEPTPVATTPPATPRPTPTTSPTPVDVDSSVDVGALPPTDATHLAVLKGINVGFLDLQTGDWVIRDVLGRSGPPGQWAFGRGIVFNADGAVVYAPVDGEPTTLRRGWSIGATTDRVWVTDNSGRVLVAVDIDGDVVDEFMPPPMTWVESVLPTGELIIRGGGRLFVRSEAEIRPVTEGEIYGRADTRALAQRCDDGLSCDFVIVELLTGESTVIELELGDGQFPQLTHDGVVLYGRESAELYRIEASSLIFDRELSFEEADAQLFGAVTQATSTGGVSVAVDDSTLRFTDGDGDTLTEGSIDFFRGFGEASLVFITVDDAA